MKKLAYICFFVLLCLATKAQKEDHMWYFGERAGMDFNSSEPVALTNGALRTVEGCASVCDNNGAILFYTDGDTIWNRNHEVMPNGTGLHGDGSSSQSAIIVKKPGDNPFYYIFTTDAAHNNLEAGFNYSIVDLNLDGGLGDVSSKNNFLFHPVAEKVCATWHENQTDIWIITHEWESNNFRAYLLTENGLNTIENITPGYPVITSVGANYGGSIWNAIGYLKVSPYGSKIGTVIHNSHFEVLDFNKSNGTVYNPIAFTNLGLPNLYGLEFSPDESKVYISNIPASSHIYQYNLGLGSPDAIRASGYLVAESTNDLCYSGMQLGPDDKIYVACNIHGYLGVINNPNETAGSCNFTDDAIFLEGKLSFRGLPNNLTYPYTYNFTYFRQCFGDTTAFNLTSSTNINSVVWDFDDPGSGIQNTSTLFNPTHIFTAPGNYMVNLLINYSGGSNNISNEITIFPLPDINLGNDTIICTGEALILNPSGDFQSYLWQDNSTEPNFTISENGLYWVEVENEFGCFNRDSVNVTIALGPEIWLGNDSTFCTGDTIMLCAGNGYPDYLWQDGSTDSCLTVTTSGNYWVEVGDEFGCMGYDTINLAFLPGPNVSLGNDTLICSNEYLQLDAGDGYSNYLWQDGSGGQTYFVTQAGEYWVEVANDCGLGSDTINIDFTEAFDIWLGNDTSFCYGQSVVLDAGAGFSSYFWNTGSTSQSIIVATTGNYWVEVNDSLDCTATDSIYIEAFMDFNISIGEDTVKICEGDYVFLNGPEGYPSYFWQDGSTYPTLLADTAGIYWLEVTDENGCAARDSTILVVNVIPADLLGNDTVICPGAELTLPASSGYQSYQWQDGFSGDSFVTNHSGKFWVTVFDDIGCSGTDTILVSDFEIPGLGLASEEWICHGDSLLLDAGEGYTSYLWQDGTTEQEYLATEDGDYYVQIETICGFYTDSVKVYFYEGNLDLGNDTILCDGEQLLLYPGTGYSNFYWSNGSTDSILIVGEKGDYWLEAFDGFCYISDSIAVDACTSIWIPNVFTPNGDEYNQTFYAKAENPAGITQFKLTIFNRWGRIVYEMDDINDKWDGRLNGNDCSAGAYFWVCDYQALDKYGNLKNHSKQGSVTLIRK